MPVEAPAAPAAKKTPRTPAKKTPETPRSRAQARAEGLSDWFKIGSLIAISRGQLADAGAISEHGPGISAATAEFAENSEPVAKIVDYICEAGPYAALAAVVMPLLFQLAANHGKIDAGKLGAASGVVPPEVLEAKVTAALEAQKAQYLREAAEARAETDRIRASMNGET